MGVVSDVVNRNNKIHVNMCKTVRFYGINNINVDAYYSYQVHLNMKLMVNNYSNYFIICKI